MLVGMENIDIVAIDIYWPSGFAYEQQIGLSSRGTVWSTVVVRCIAYQWFTGIWFKRKLLYNLMDLKFLPNVS
ncbi:MAG: hypothetical protein CMIDDMOC_00198 [Sodalis sp. Fle]|nr:MAG: hypothetical protein CMIDDMOC_00198 [Sodalis sp. Fle]